MPTGGRWSPPHSSKLSPLGTTRSLSDPSPILNTCGLTGRFLVACLFEYMF